MPLFNSAFKNARSAPPSPPAAPAPLTYLISIFKISFILSAKCSRFLSSNSTISVSAPFCGPKIYEAPVGPINGLVTSHATSIVTSFMLLCKLDKSIVSILFKHPPPNEISLLFSSKSFTPKA